MKWKYTNIERQSLNFETRMLRYGKHCNKCFTATRRTMDQNATKFSASRVGMGPERKIAEKFSKIVR